MQFTRLKTKDVMQFTNLKMIHSYYLKIIFSNFLMFNEYGVTNELFYAKKYYVKFHTSHIVTYGNSRE